QRAERLQPERPEPAPPADRRSDPHLRTAARRRQHDAPAGVHDRSIAAPAHRRAASDGADARGRELRRGHAVSDAQVRGEGPVLMRDDLLTYYERELTFVRRMAGE